ncbi:TonB-linked outer membrane protein, SusC/RagA family [Sinomicrobium oceani]|uniref:TonB-linked outer membrane protein, SusC/RagA family n=1 Tax=Sinomicrobium oceani TaxID=1150368 RepID=A0A1K1MLM8_9FLAO|nr:TonB-dependent receptor [Sinomicrobium oceani]SFW24074.1 TonB-linked outer membrane protein, SusC/RagA family [Sinomicrobium oceani]
MRKSTVLSILLNLFCITGLMAQQILEGTVVSKKDNAPIPAATVVADNGSGKGTSTDFDGNFTLSVNQEEGILKVSSMGYTPREVRYKAGEKLYIELEDEINQLDEVVLIGYGSAKKGDLTAAVATVENVESIASRPVSNVNDFLQGNLPGVTVLQQGGDPTQNGQIVIRGYGSFATESPLTVVDGVPYYGPPINPNDIASISVLKDAAAAAIYGAQASSGVIVIETKSGKSGKPKVSLDVYTGFQKANNLPTALNAEQQAWAYNTAADNAGASRLSAHNAEQNPWGQTTRTNWMDEIFRTATLYNVNANVSGGAENVRYMTSFGYQKKEGVLIGTQRERYNFRVKTDFDLTEKITIGENVYYSRTDAVGTNTSSAYSGSIINAIYMPAAASVYNDDGTYQGVVPEELAQFAGAYGDVYNPVALLLRPTTTNPTDFINANVYFKYDILDGLKFKSTYSYNYTGQRYKKFQPRIPELGRTNLNNYLYQSNATTNKWIWDNQISYDKTFGKHHLNATAIYSSQHTDYEYYYQEGQGFSSEEPYNQYMGNATSVLMPETDVYEDALTSAIGRVMYNYDNRYYLTASLRRDASSRLARSNQSDYFPSASAAWRIGNEAFFENIHAVSDLKLRASWGQIGNINSVGYYSYDVPMYNTMVATGEGSGLDDKGTYLGRQSNPNLKWETSESIDIGLDASLFNNTLGLTVDYFEKRTKQMIIPGLEDAHQGTLAPDVNGGEVKNTGWEFALNYNNTIGDLQYGITAGASLLDNKLVNLHGYSNGGIDYIAHSDNVRSILTPFRSKVGQPLYSYHLIPQQGIFQTQEEINAYTGPDGQLIQPNAVPGDFKFADTNGDGKIDDNDRVFMGNYQPDVTYNFTLNLNYKNFDLSMFFQGVGGAKAFNGYKLSTYNASLQGYNLDNRVLNAWSPENTHTGIPRLSTSDNNHTYGNSSSWYLEDASYLRMKNITLGYNLPEKALAFMGDQASLRVFFSADNVFTMTNYSGLDPEVGNNGLDIGRYPLSGVYTLGLNFQF